MKPRAASNRRFWRFFYDTFAFAYDFVLAWADRLGLGAEGRVRRELVSRIPIAADARALDLGCGTAANRPFLPSEVFYIGIDVSRGMLRRAQAKARQSGWQAALLQADAGALPFQQGCMDAILAVGVMQHVSEVQIAVKESQRVAAPGARRLIADEGRAWDRMQPAFGGLEPRWVSDYFAVTDTL